MGIIKTFENFIDTYGDDILLNNINEGYSEDSLKKLSMQIKDKLPKNVGNVKNIRVASGKGDHNFGTGSIKIKDPKKLCIIADVQVGRNKRPLCLGTFEISTNTYYLGKMPNEFDKSPKQAVEEVKKAISKLVKGINIK
jgi:hypothetical protein